MLVLDGPLRDLPPGQRQEIGRRVVEMVEKGL
jgi:hypothetical protein